MFENRPWKHCGSKRESNLAKRFRSIAERGVDRLVANALTAFNHHGELQKAIEQRGLAIEVPLLEAPRGTPVRAAADGVVAYAGNEIRGFGNLLLIRHADGWMTAYAHNDKLLVKRGDKIAQGQQIAHVGATGNVVSPQLHFEIRRGKRAVDPLDQLGSLRTS
jgi:hypothetical protein